MATERFYHARKFRGPCRRFRRLLRRIANAQSAAAIDIAQRNSRARKITHKSGEARQRAAVRIHRKNLRTDMRADSLPVNPSRTAVLQIKFAPGFPVNSKFVAMVPRGDVRMAAGLDVRIDANG